MTAYAIGVFVAAAAAGATIVAVSMAAGVAWSVTQQRLSRLAPRTRAEAIAALRLFPAASGLGAAIVVLVTFALLEPADTREVVGVVLVSAALVTAGVSAVRLLRAYRAWVRTARAVAAWSAQPQLVDSDFPIVAVIGIWRPRLYVARRVAALCDREELDAMIAHERAHVAARDNLTRLCFLCAPFALPRVARDLELAWTRASEEAADDAARRDERTSLALASALTKVAQLAIGQPMPLLHVSAIFSGSSVAERVYRLLETPLPTASDQWRWRYVAGIAIAAAAVSSAAVMEQIHEAAEYCVRYLP